MGMTAPFTPVGEKPQWELVYEELQGLDVGDVLTYHRLCEVVKRPLPVARGPLYKAARVWGEENKRALRPEKGVGYRVVDAPEHELIARSHHRKSRRSLARSRFALKTADRSRLDPEMQKRFDGMELTVSRHEEVIRRLTVKQARMDKALQEAAATTEATTERLARLEDTLRRHGIEVTP